ncbi:MAG: sugar kinase [Ilumatobacter sp.]|uniref:sugar kinase n=1 Tax=Ilumatobacter sp. TaxID=1967498 RepID=UPI002623E2B0|nr:sugar kinase [Ilumatobacter sp.]MDJ0771392.1 sugar kinase [Ilumatobacter sp.]
MERDGETSERFDLVSIGETMVGLVSHDDQRRFTATMAGAASNVAVGMAQLGCRVRWVSRLGDDPLGRFLEDEIGGRGVDVAVERDGSAPTGVLTKHVVETRTVTQYYRSESAASRLSVQDLGRVGPADRIHVTGITPALSASARGLAAAIVDRSTGFGGRVSFDVNHRPVLWPDTATAAAVLLELAQRSDVVFVGDDEAEALWGTAAASAVGELILRRNDQEVVLKQGARGATLVTGDGEVTQPALAVELVEATGAGDAFAAGYLAAGSFGWSPRDRLRLGHVMGARVIGVLDDTPPPFTPTELAEITPERVAARWS